MNLDQLVAFDMVVREGSFSRAAWALQMAQPTVSMRIQALEQSVGGPLFHRRGRGVSLTDLGSSFLPYARRAIAILGEGIAAAREAQLGQRGRVSLGALGSLAGGLIGPALADFQRRRPQVECVVRSANHEPLIEQLYDGLIELALLAWPCVEALTEPMEVLFELQEPVPLVAGAGHPLAQLSPVSAAQIAALAQPFLCLRWWQTLHPVVARLAAQAAQTSDVPMEVALVMIRQGVGAGFFTQTFIGAEVQTGQSVALAVRDLPPLYRHSALVRLQRAAPLSPAAHELVATLRSHAARLGLLRA